MTKFSSLDNHENHEKPAEKKKKNWVLNILKILYSKWTYW